MCLYDSIYVKKCQIILKIKTNKIKCCQKGVFMRTERRIIVITGASSGMGLGLREMYEKIGDIVVDISMDGRDFQCDVTDAKKLKKCFNEIGKNYGQIDMFISCAGYGLNGAVELISEEDAKKQFDVNFFGTALACKYAIPLLKQNGKIILLSSVSALFPVPFKAYYCSSKAAVDSFANCLRMELSKTSIQVTSICPKEVKTNFSKNRVKVYQTNERYGNAIENLFKSTEKGEAKRMPQNVAVEKIFKICEKEKLRPRYIIGNDFKIFNFFRKILSKNSMNKILTKKFYKYEK